MQTINMTSEIVLAHNDSDRLSPPYFWVKVGRYDIRVNTTANGTATSAKKRAAMIFARNPYTAKSYHSSKFPTDAATAARLSSRRPGLCNR